mmetsp:Transcript_27755/g.75575  ORF Transcript_27755/g.75575 Transcript_27755/m.75575 type:complete len:245 (-) Transcript_27755:183-917(-)
MMMMMPRTSLCLFVAAVCTRQVYTSLALTTATALCQKSGASGLMGLQRQRNNYGRLSRDSFHILYSTPGPGMPSEEENLDWTDEGGPSMSLPVQEQQQQTPPAYTPPAPTPARNSPQAVAQRRMDPLMASLTRDNSDASPDQSTQNVPIFGEIPADGTLFLLVPAVVFAVLGFVLSLVIAVKSSDQIVESFAQAGDTIAQTASERTNRVYDESTCRGFCSPQPDDVEGLRNFMESITRSAREGK